MPWGGVKTETKEKSGKLIERLHAIWYASRYEAYNGDRLAHEPYFANTPPSYPRMSFGAAAKHYAMDEPRCGFPDMPEALPKMVLALALEMMERTHDRLMPA